MNRKSDKILTSKDEIMDFMKIGEAVLNHFLRLGLPVTKIGRNWYAHTDNLEEWFKMKTKRQGTVVIPD